MDVENKDDTTTEQSIDKFERDILRLEAQAAKLKKEVEQAVTNSRRRNPLLADEKPNDHELSH